MNNETEFWLRFLLYKERWVKPQLYTEGNYGAK